jgi:hypothetical protein
MRKIMKLEARTGRVQIYPSLSAQYPVHGIPSDEIGSAVNKNRIKTGKDTGRFYTHVFHALYGGEIMREGSGGGYAARFPLIDEVGTTFFPDILLKNGTLDLYIEVKAFCASHGLPKFGFRQFCNYTRSFLENPNSATIAGIFKYGTGGSNNRGKLYLCKFHGKEQKPTHHCNSQCVASSLSSSTRDLIILPHNLLSFLLSISKTEVHNQESSQSPIDSEEYFLPKSHWLTLLKENADHPERAIEAVLADESILSGRRRITRKLPDPSFFLLEGLAALQYESPDNIYYGPHRIRNGVNDKTTFRITDYTPSDSSGWAEHIARNLEEFLDEVGIYQTWFEAKKSELPEKPRDEIPF